MRVLRLIIDRDAVQKTACDKWAADLPILQAMYGSDGAVVVQSSYDLDVERTVEEERDRLKSTYGLKPNTDIPWVEYVYGRSNDSLERAMRGEDIDADVEVEPTPGPTTSVAPKKTARKKAATK